MMIYVKFQVTYSQKKFRVTLLIKRYWKFEDAVLSTVLCLSIFTLLPWLRDFSDECRYAYNPMILNRKTLSMDRIEGPRSWRDFSVIAGVLLHVCIIRQKLPRSLTGIWKRIWNCQLFWLIWFRSGKWQDCNFRRTP